jgi:sugar fermentation stimulation protein A
MHWKKPFFEGTFISRLSRFSARVKKDQEEINVYLPNSGRLQELLTFGRHCWITPANVTPRKTEMDLALVDVEGHLVSIDARIPKRLLNEVLTSSPPEELKGYPSIRSEVLLGKSRLDFMLSSGNGRNFYIEAKSVTLVREGRALFPDAPTLRGSQHLKDLIRAKEAGHRAAIIFVVQRPDAKVFSPHEEADPPFAVALRVAARLGVEVYAYACNVTLEEINISRRIEVLL